MASCSNENSNLIWIVPNLKYWLVRSGPPNFMFSFLFHMLKDSSPSFRRSLMGYTTIHKSWEFWQTWEVLRFYDITIIINGLLLSVIQVGAVSSKELLNNRLRQIYLRPIVSSPICFETIWTKFKKKKLLLTLVFCLKYDISIHKGKFKSQIDWSHQNYEVKASPCIHKAV